MAGGRRTGPIHRRRRTPFPSEAPRLLTKTRGPAPAFPASGGSAGSRRDGAREPGCGFPRHQSTDRTPYHNSWNLSLMVTNLVGERRQAVFDALFRGAQARAHRLSDLGELQAAEKPQADRVGL